MKKTIAITLAGIMIFASTAIYAADQQTYKDLKTTNWAYESVKAMSDKDIIKGYPDKSFRPQNTVTYGEFIKMMVVAVTGEELTVADKPHHWAYNYYQKALELKLFEEADIDKSMLNQPISRKYMALIISNGLGKLDIENYSEIEKTVKDVDSKTKYDYHIIKSYATGILSGYTDQTFKPDGTLNRAESSLVIYRFIEPEKRTPVTENTDEDTTKVKLNVVKAGKDISEVVDASTLKEMFDIVYMEPPKYDGYQIVTDVSPFQMKLKNKMGYYWIEMVKVDDLLGNVNNVALITDGKVSSVFKNVRFYDNVDVINYKGDISTVDYILIVPFNGGIITLVENPFK
ncbi:S-layer homology domain-containing protein [Anaerovorax sp. IOR16]|uniref:S-layer homology domain-containing protein n=1 Tax=Anaerovorax sp. IOR16 TaxID=2773458 RepID=UPI0019D1E9F5|nr:S-layer homology domain-containing protein [Anaerovorax sp. IOR16]